MKNYHEVSKKIGTEQNKKSLRPLPVRHQLPEWAPFFFVIEGGRPMSTEQQYWHLLLTPSGAEKNNTSFYNETATYIMIS